MASKVERLCILIFKHNLGPRGPTRTRRKARTTRVDAFCSLPRQVSLDERNLSGLLGLKIQKVKMKPWQKRKRRSCLEIFENWHFDVPSRNSKVRFEVAAQFSSSAFISFHSSFTPNLCMLSKSNLLGQAVSVGNRNKVP